MARAGWGDLNKAARYGFRAMIAGLGRPDVKCDPCDDFLAIRGRNRRPGSNEIVRYPVERVQIMTDGSMLKTVYCANGHEFTFDPLDNRDN